jgi:5'-phosphate synthase pdxT subunit
VLARVDGWPVWVRQGTVMATTFHPELTPDPRVHRTLLEAAAKAAAARVELR